MSVRESEMNDVLLTGHKGVIGQSGDRGSPGFHGIGGMKGTAGDPGESGHSGMNPSFIPDHTPSE